MKTLLLSAGRKNGNNEILGKQALMQIQKNVEVKFKLSVCRICILNSVLDVKAV